MKPIVIAAALATAATGCTTLPSQAPQPIARIAVASSTGAALGLIHLEPWSDGYRLVGTLQALPAGTHGIHLHAIGMCAAPDFVSAAGHLNPGLRQHGSLNPAGTHLGDLPNIAVAADGSAQLTLELHGTRAELDRAMFDRDGTALVVHAGPDDYRTDPSGNSGARIACGTLQRP